MKNLIATMLILISYSVITAQVPTRTEQDAKEQQKRREVYQQKMKTEQANKKMYSEKGEFAKEKNPFYIEIKIIKNEDEDKFIISKFDKTIETKEDKEIYLKIEMLSKIEEMAKRGKLNYVNEFGKMGYKIISHSFAFQKDNEVHYYILEL